MVGYCFIILIKRRMEMKKINLMVLVCFMFVGCADWSNKAKNQGGYFTSHRSDYIVISQSGGLIMDVWKLRNVFVSSPNGSDGWVFTDIDGNSITTGGDCKNIRLNGNGAIWEKYHEYHMEFESMTYTEKHNK